MADTQLIRIGSENNYGMYYATNELFTSTYHPFDSFIKAIKIEYTN